MTHLCRSPQLCQRCHAKFTPTTVGKCRYHPESFSGEDSQRWTVAGERPPEGKSTVYYFYSCCGAADVDAPGCVVGRHSGFGEEDEWGKKPEMRPPSP